MDVTFRFLGPGRGWRPDRGDRSSLRDDLRRALGLRPGGGFGPAGRRPLRLLRRRDRGRRAALPHGDEPGGGRRRGRPLRPGGDAAGRPRPAPLHPHQALPDGLGAGARAWPGCSARRPPPTPTASAPTSSWGRTRPASCSAGSRPRSPTTPPPRAPRRRQSAALFYTKLNDGHERARLRARAPPRDRRPDAGAVRAARDAGRSPPPETELARADRAAGRGRRGPQPGADHGPGARRRPGDGDRGRAPPPLPPRAASTPSTSTCRWSSRRRRWSPTTSSGSASPTPASSPTTAPTATCCGCSRCTGSESRPTTSPSPRTTGASCSSTCSPTCRPGA